MRLADVRKLLEDVGVRFQTAGYFSGAAHWTRRWERRVSLPESIDPDMLDERARALLNYADPRDLMLRLKQP
jgi:hypothetical protein